jgi:hypothetical protein
VSDYLLPPWTDPDADGQPAASVPAVVLVYGGPSDERAEWDFGPFAHWLANRGFAVLYPDYRGSPGLGKKLPVLPTWSGAGRSTPICWSRSTGRWIGRSSPPTRSRTWVAATVGTPPWWG